MMGYMKPRSFLIPVALLIILLAASCDGHIDTEYTITFHAYGIRFADGTTADKIIDVKYGNPIPESDIPRLSTEDISGGNFIGWCEKDSQAVYDLSTPINQDITLCPKWEDFVVNKHGEETNYIVFSSKGLDEWITAASADPATNCILAASITLPDPEESGGSNWIPIGTGEKPFTGFFGGSGYAIRNLRIAASASALNGLFGAIGTDGKVQNLVLEDIAVTGKGSSGGIAGSNAGTITSCIVTGILNNYQSTDDATGSDSEAAGGIAGKSTGSISGCTVAATISGRETAGGIAGRNEGSISGCFTEGRIIGVDNIGGIAGISKKEISQSASAASITGGGDIGGIAGLNDGGTIDQCTFSGSLSDSYYYIGGIAGHNTGSGRIARSSFTGSISASTEYLGGITGLNSAGTIEACWSSGSISGDADAGGIVGFNMPGSHVSFCYSSGTIEAEIDAAGIAGNNNGPIESCYTTADIHGSRAAGAIIGEEHGSGSANNCFWQTGSVQSGIGHGGGSEGIYRIGESGLTWQSAMDKMNEGTDYRYAVNTGTDAASFPLIIRQGA